jgi:cysteine desulfurase
LASWSAGEATKISSAAMIYLDYNATAPVRPEVIEAVRAAMSGPGNASSVHGAGRQARRAIEAAREAVAALAGAGADAVVFTSGGTEANNQAISSAGGTVLVSSIEHESVLAAAGDAPRLAVDGQGRIDLAALEAQLTTLRPALVSIMLANNETGVVQPVAEAAGMARRHGALSHCDAVQAAGKLDLDMTLLGVDLLSLSAHKLGGPQGVGALVLGPGIEPRALLRGGGQERRRRPGTENLPGIAGFGCAAERALADRSWRARIGALRDRMEAEILALAPSARIFGREASRLPNTSCLAMPGVSNETQLIAFDLQGIAVSTGSACSSGKVGPSHVLSAMGVAPEEAACAIRVSLGWASVEADIGRFVGAWERLFSRAGREAEPLPA